MYAGHFDFAHPLVWTVDGLLSADACLARLRALESAEWLHATVNSATGRVVKANLRNNMVAVLRDPEDAAQLFARIAPHAPAEMCFEESSKVTLFGLNTPLRVYRYDVGQSFGVHIDQSYRGPDETLSRLTFMVYLNDDFEGGETTFPPLDQVVEPRTGRMVLFQHAVEHAGEVVTRGTKYVLRSDVLYRRT